MTKVLALIALVAAAGCGKEIGDECIVSSDCSSDGTRICDGSQKGGYCTIQGCDFSTCPDEAVCVRFFTGSFANKPCDPATEDVPDANGTFISNDCSLDELCALEGHCAPRSAETRFCMKRCDSDGDCRDGYECRTFELMQEHGGEPVLDPKLGRADENAPKFCAVAPG